jgi:heterodisulfide reductase subunit C
MMSVTSTFNPDLARMIRQRTGENVYQCYQCVKCTSGCPLAEYFDLWPNQIMRSVQLGQTETALDNRTIWICASCETCTTRCPQGLDIARVMDALKMIAYEQGREPKVNEVALFHKVFLKNVKIWGRIYELGLMAEMNLRTGQPFKDLPMGLEMVSKGKINFLPSIGRRPSRVKPVDGAHKKIAYYPGCSLHGSAHEFDVSSRAVLAALGVAVEEPAGWVCCGSTVAHSRNELLAATFPMINLTLIEQAGFHEVALPCAACFNRFKTAAYQVANNPNLKTMVD